MTWFGDQIANSIKPAMQTLANTQASATGSINQFYDKAIQSLDDSKQYITPYAQAGINAFSDYNQALGLPGADGKTISSDTVLSRFQNSPGYQAMLQQGLGSVNSRASAQGLLGSGAQGQALSKYAADYANTGYQQYVSNLGNEANTVYNGGITAAGQLGQLGQAAASAATTAGGNIANVTSTLGADTARLQAGNRSIGPGLSVVGLGASSF